MRLKNKTVIVTGAGSGLGKATALLSAEEGANLILADIRAESLESVKAEIAGVGGRAATVSVDVCRSDSIDDMLGKAVADFGQVDCLVNCAGVFSSIPLLEMREEDFDRMTDINLKGSFLCSQAFIRQLIAQDSGGAIVFLSSISGYIGFANSAHYCASKGAIRQLSKAIALEFGPRRIRSNVVAPGTIETPMNQWIIDDPDRYAQSVSSIPLGRLGKASEIASAIVFLLSEDASFCTGSELVVDGGQITHC
ncbi:MAG: SDR family oxidoreductase [Clostridiales Family XIII bacterium]|jgi:NAD(P)-dependent dehydrogenase (short-subunit alcohol dehydrogenase family)|nr:SDR family oxidoreductase [Clostridiales Family XIII bacterium]